MKIELLNVRIYLSKNTVTVDSIGNHKNEWQPYYTCYATVSAEGGKEMTDAGWWWMIPPLTSPSAGVLSPRQSPPRAIGCSFRMNCTMFCLSII